MDRLMEKIYKEAERNPGLQKFLEEFPPPPMEDLKKEVRFIKEASECLGLSELVNEKTRKEEEDE